VRDRSLDWVDEIIKVPNAVDTWFAEAMTQWKWLR
jgi:hypothetical protein